MNLTIDAIGKQYRGGNWALKDFTLMAEQARHIGQRLPLAETYTGLMKGCVENGEGDWDNAAVIQEIRRRRDEV